MSDDGGHHHDAFDEEAPEYLKTLKRTIPRVSGLSEDDREDITQTSLLELLKAEQRTEVKNKEGYLATTARHERYDLWRQRKKEGAVSYDDEKDEKTQKDLDRKAAEAENPIFRLLERLDAQKIFNSLPASIWDKFTEDDFKLLRLRFEEDCSFEEIGQLMGTSEAEARYQYQKLIARLRARVRKYFEGGGDPS
jgi:RNA polymerase sigma factor (sigma-70 family)